MQPSDKKEVHHLYLKMHDMMLTYAMTTLPQQLAEDAVQETFYIACQKVDSLRNSSNPEGWLITTLKNVISNTVRQQQSIRTTLENYTAERLHEILTFEESLPLETLYGNIADTQEFILLKELVVDGKSYTELAKDRGINVPTCRKRVQRAKEYLQNKLKKDVTKTQFTTHISERRSTQDDT